MGLLRFIGRRRREARLSDIAQVIAERCRAAVGEIISDRIAGMSLAETRGYVRARASAPIRREVTELIERDRSLVERDGVFVTQQAKAVLVRSLCRELRRSQHAASPLRRAA